MQSVQSGNIIDVFVFSFHIGQLQTVLVGNSYDMGRVLLFSSCVTQITFDPILDQAI